MFVVRMGVGIVFDNDLLEIFLIRILIMINFEDFIVKSGAKGSFMVYRSKKSDDELGIDEL